VEPLPPQAPELNPADGIWRYVKYGRLANYTPLDLGILRRKVIEELDQLKCRAELLRSFVLGEAVLCMQILDQGRIGRIACRSAVSRSRCIEALPARTRRRRRPRRRWRAAVAHAVIATTGIDTGVSGTPCSGNGASGVSSTGASDTIAPRAAEVAPLARDSPRLETRS